MLSVHANKKIRRYGDRYSGIFDARAFYASPARGNRGCARSDSRPGDVSSANIAPRRPFYNEPRPVMGRHGMARGRAAFTAGRPRVHVILYLLAGFLLARGHWAWAAGFLSLAGLVETSHHGRLRQIISRAGGRMP